jgi:hypothetical protein
MSGTNISVVELSPGVYSDATEYSTGKHWYKVNQVRWVNNIMVPVGGWIRLFNFGTGEPYISALSIPIPKSTDVVAGKYTFVDADLGSGVARKIVVAVNLSFQAGTVPLAGSVIVKINGGAATLKASNVSLGIAKYVGIFISNADVTVVRGNIEVDFTASGFTALNCMIFPFSVKGGNVASIVSAFANSSNTDSVTTNANLALPVDGSAIAISTVTSAVDDPISFTSWSGSIVTGHASVEDSNAYVATNIGSAVGLNATITATGTLTGAVNRQLVAIAVPPSANIFAIRDMFSWRDNLKNPWMAAGAADRLWAASISAITSYTKYDITPLALSSNPGGLAGWGRGAWGSGAWGLDTPGGLTIDGTALWSMDNWGRNLIAVHSQDGRLFQWDPTTPTTIAAVVLNAPIDNTLCIATEEEFAMVLGGKNNPRRVKWSSQRDITDWIPTETNSAGGFDLKSNGTIISARKVQGGILVQTDADTHMIEYIGAPNYYGHRKVSNNTSILGKNSIADTPYGVMWVGKSGFWTYDGNVNKMECPIHSEVFYNSNFNDPALLTMGYNAYSSEVWFFMPSKNSGQPDKYVAFSFAQTPYWTEGDIPRTSWLNPVWQNLPLATNGNTVYQHETGNLADGVSRNGIIYAKTGAMEIGEGEQVMRVDRIWQDAGVQNLGSVVSDPLAYTATFGLRQAPNAPESIYGPVFLGSEKGYTTVRFRARQISFKIDQTKDELWTLGKIRLRVKGSGRR